MNCPSLESWLSAIEEGNVRPEGAHEACEDCARNESEARAMLECLRRSVPRSPVSDEAFVQRVVAGARPRRRLWMITAGPLAAAAVVLLALWLGKTPRPDAPVARGGDDRDAPICEVAEVTGAGLSFLHDGDRVPEGARLAFRVRNASGAPRFVGVFAVTRAGQVGWFHPAWESAADDPKTLALAAAREPRLLPESVALPLGRGPVRVFCWQSDRRWSVREADAAIGRAVSGHDDATTVERIDPLGGTQSGIRLSFGP